MPRNTARQGQSRGQGQRSEARFGTGDFVSVSAANAWARGFYLHTVGRCVPEAYQATLALDEADGAQWDTWATRWGFTDSWALDIVRRYAGLWRENPELVGRAFSVGAVGWEPVFPPGPTWNPIVETEDRFRARVDAYIADVQRTPGITPTPVKRNEEHFEWLALHHVGSWTYDRVAQRYQDEMTGNPNIAAIGHAITGTAALVGVTLREARGRKSS